jgi:choline kinase/ubiquinone/menaquinone biosynthesis C-methylase UbiE
MKAIILAAGSDSKLGKISDGRPKCLVEIEDSPLLEIQINTLHACGIEDIAVVRGYKYEQIDIPGLNYYENHDYENKNVLYSLFCAQSEMTGDVLILYGDILFEEQTVKRLLESKHDIAVGVMVNWQESIQQRKDKDINELEMVYFDAENRIRKIGKGLIDEYETRGQFIGMVKCSGWGMEIIKRNHQRDKFLYADGPYGASENIGRAWLSDLFNEMVNIGVPLHCVMIERGWLEINTEEDYMRALTDTNFVRRLVKIKTDWKERVLTYNNLEWVNRDETLDAIAELSSELDGKKALDLGTGTGKVLMALKKKCNNAEYYGVDYCKDMMDGIDPSYGFKLSVMKAESLEGFKNEEFDLVTARMVVHHIENIDRAVGEVSRVLKYGGRFIICEGNPPDRNSVEFYEEMFRFKENRRTFLIDDLTNLLIRHGFGDITSKTIVLKDMSLNNWLYNSGVPYRNMDIIRRMHYECDTMVKKAYNMKNIEDDILMDWKFSVVMGIK